MNLQVKVQRDGWLWAQGDTNRVEMIRSVLVEDSDDWCEPVLRFVRQHGLVLAHQEEMPAESWWLGRVEYQVFVPPGERDAAYAKASDNIEWFWYE